MLLSPSLVGVERYSHLPKVKVMLYLIAWEMYA